MRSRALAAGVLLVGLSVCACDRALVAIPFGVWAGPEARLDVDTSGAHFRFGCAAAEVAPPLSLDDDGRYDLAGSYTFQAGPEPYPTFPARFVGRVRGQALTVEVRLQGDPPHVVGPFDLRLGAEPPQLGLCR